MKTAYFVRRPRVLVDLLVPHPVEAEREYEVAARVLLSGLDFENFATDMLADRAFIEEHAALCGEGEVLRCLLVRRRGGARGLRVFYLQSFRGYTPSSVSLLMAATTPGLSSR